MAYGNKLESFITVDKKETYEPKNTIRDDLIRIVCLLLSNISKILFFYLKCNN